RRELLQFAPAIGLRTLKRLAANDVHREAVKLGDFLSESFPLSRETPEILQITANSHAKLGQEPKRLMTLEKLALLLPAQSLWRSRFAEDPEATKAMEAIAREASEAVAVLHYDRGLATGNES